MTSPTKQPPLDQPENSQTPGQNNQEESTTASASPPLGQMLGQLTNFKIPDQNNLENPRTPSGLDQLTNSQTPDQNTPEKPGTASTPPPPGSFRNFEKLIENDLGNPKLAEFVSGQQNRAKPQARPLPLKVATIASTYLNSCLAQTCNVTELRTDQYGDVLAQAIAEADFLLVETSWLYADQDWATVVRRRDAGLRNRLLQILQECAERGVPTALWFTLDRTHLDIFAHLHGEFSATFTADPEVAHNLAKQDGPTPVALPPAVEPTLHNPLSRNHDGFNYIRKDFGICSDSYNELSGLGGASDVQALLDPALDYMLWLFETRYLMRNNNARLPKDFRRRFIGCFDDAARATFLKNSRFYLPVTPASDIPNYERTRNILEAMAFKTAVFSNTAPFLEAVDPFIRRTETPDAMRDALSDFMGNPHLHRMVTHLAYREVMENHTYADRLRTICATLGIAPEKAAKQPDPLVTALVPTMRPELLPFMLDGYRRQNYKNLEMVIVLHSDHYSPSDIAPMLREEDRAKVIRVPEDQSVGMALNAGIDASNGDYWARIDDDDYYGPNYFNDAMLNRKFEDFDICGKSQWFIYFEALNGAFVHKQNWAAHSLNPMIAGGTFLVRHSRDGRFRFNDRVRGYADVELIGREIDNGDCRIVSSDPFNFLQIRRMDLRSHTWTADANKIRTTEKISDGMNLARVGI